jgi:hypothetical protein
MAIKYVCRHCQFEIGRLEQKEASTRDLGFHHLNDQERLDMVSYESNGDVKVNAICEDCQEALQRNPDYHQLETFIQ